MPEGTPLEPAKRGAVQGIGVRHLLLAAVRRPLAPQALLELVLPFDLSAVVTLLCLAGAR